MKDLPGALFVVDPKRKNRHCRSEKIWNIPTVAIVDTNCDPEEVDYVIPGNDDAIRAVKLLVSRMADAVIEGNQGMSMAEDVEEEIAEAEEEAMDELPPSNGILRQGS